MEGTPMTEASPTPCNAQLSVKNYEAMQLEEDRLLHLKEPTYTADRLEMSDDDNEYLEEMSDGEAPDWEASGPDSLWARPQSFNFGSAGRASIQALAARGVVNDRKKSLEAGEKVCDDTTGVKACSDYKVDLTGSEFGVCKCGFPKADHMKAAASVRQQVSPAQCSEIEGHMQKLSSKNVWNKRFFKLDFKKNPPSLMYYPNVRNAWNMMKRGKRVLDKCLLTKVEMKKFEIHLTADNGSVCALKANSREDALMWYEGLLRLSKVHTTGISAIPTKP